MVLVFDVQKFNVTSETRLPLIPTLAGLSCLISTHPWTPSKSTMTHPTACLHFAGRNPEKVGERQLPPFALVALLMLVYLQVLSATGLLLLLTQRSGTRCQTIRGILQSSNEQQSFTFCQLGTFYPARQWPLTGQIRATAPGAVQMRSQGGAAFQ